VRRRVAALGCLATIAFADYVIRRRTPRWLVIGLFDEPAHAATAALVLLNMPRRSATFTAAFLAGSVLPDVDHVPLALAPEHPGADDPRPRSHSLAAAAPVAAAAGLTRSEALAGVAAGMLTHLARDVATGPGAPLLWPASERELHLPWPAYAAACLILAGSATLVDGL
jgi:inner membrane protein